MLTIDHLTKHYKGTDKGVTDVSLHVAPGSLCAFVGPNGAGKTTLLKCVTGIHDFDAGAIRIGGVDLRADPIACKRQFAYLPDNPDLYEYLTGSQYLAFLADVFALSEDVRRARTEALCAEFELSDALGSLISAYSHGMKQKLALIGALLHEPKLLILDEPFVGLDPKASRTLKAQMRALCDRGGAIFFSTHVLDVAEKLCDSAVIIRDGRIAAQGRMEELIGKGSLEDVFMEVVDE